MKAILITIFLLTSQISFSQNDKKPSWSEAMPEREEAPKMDLDHSVNTDIDLGLDRESLFADEDDVSEDEPVNVEEERIANEKAEQERVANEEAEQKRVANEEAEQKRIADELAEQERIANELAEQERIANELAEQERIASETEEQQPVEEETMTKTESLPVETNTPIVVKQKYSWKKIKNAAPVYPSKAFRLKKEGWVDVQLTIDTQGKVVEAKVVEAQSGSMFNAAATKAVRKWKFEPPADFDINESQTTTVRIAFNL